MTPPRLDTAEIVRALKLYVPGGVTEIRALDARIDGRTGTVSGYFDSPDRAANEIARLQSWGGVYFIPNAINPAILARRAHRLAIAGKGETTPDNDIIARRWLLIDADPIRPAGIGSNDAEHAATLERIQKVNNFLAENGWPEGIIADSGNGAHLTFLIDLPADDGGLVERVLIALAELFNDDVVKIDTSVHNAARIWKLPGTLAAKGDSIPERPHRMARIISAPAALTLVIRDQLEHIAAQAQPKPVAPARPSRANGTPFDADAWIVKFEPDADGPHNWNGGRKWILKQCAFDQSHDGSSAVIIQHASGAMDYRCLHNSCSGNRWAEYREMRAPGYRDRQPQRINRPEVTEPGETIPDYGDAGAGEAVDAIRLKTICMADVRNEPVNWKVRDVLAEKVVTVLAGDPDAGKSTLALYWACMFSIGGALPDGSRAPICETLICTAEESTSITTGPRIDAMGGDRSKIHVLDCIDYAGDNGGRRERSFTVADVSIVRQYLIERPAIKFVVFDPWSAYLPDGKDSYKTSDVRGLIAPIQKAVADDRAVSVLIVSHFNKGAAGGNALYRVNGALGLIAAARIGWALIVDNESPIDGSGQHIGRKLLSIKNNLGPKGLGRTLIARGKIEWTGETSANVNDELKGSEATPGPKPVAKEAAAIWLTHLLKSGPVPVGDEDDPQPGTIRRQAKDASISWRTIRRAQEGLNVISEKCPYTGKYQWRFQKAGCPTGCPTLSDSDNVDNLDNHSISNGNIYISKPPIGGCPSIRERDNLYQNPTGNGEQFGLPDVAAERGVA